MYQIKQINVMWSHKGLIGDFTHFSVFSADITLQWRSSVTKSGGAQIFKVKSKKKKKKKKRVTPLLNKVICIGVSR